MAPSRTGSRGSAAGVGGSAQSPTAASNPLVGRVRERVSQELNARKERASEVIENIAGTVRRVGAPLHDESLERLGAYADEAAARLDRLASGLRERDVAELADDVRRFGRQHPGVFAAIGFAAGVVAARFVKSTAVGGGRSSRRSMAADRPARAGGGVRGYATAGAATSGVPASPGYRSAGRGERTK